jgi:hypothetical protein
VRRVRTGLACEDLVVAVVAMGRPSSGLVERD